MKTPWLIYGIALLALNAIVPRAAYSSDPGYYCAKGPMPGQGRVVINTPKSGFAGVIYYRSNEILGVSGILGESVSNMDQEATSEPSGFNPGVLSDEKQDELKALWESQARALEEFIRSQNIPPMNGGFGMGMAFTGGSGMIGDTPVNQSQDFAPLRSSRDANQRAICPQCSVSTKSKGKLPLRAGDKVEERDGDLVDEKRAGDKVGQRLGDIVMNPGSVSFEAVMDANGKVRELVYAKSEQLGGHLKPGAEANADPVFRRVQSSISRWKKFASCCSDPNQSACGRKVPREAISESRKVKVPTSPDSDDSPSDTAIANPLGGAARAK